MQHILIRIHFMYMVSVLFKNCKIIKTICHNYHEININQYFMCNLAANFKIHELLIVSEGSFKAAKILFDIYT
jgi:hypothetical protein